MIFEWSLDPYVLKFQSCTRPTLPWLEETRYTAKLIASRTSKPIWLCLSGGIDSEVMAEAFLAEKIPFRAFSLSYYGRNDHDIRHAVNWCKAHGVEHEIEAVNIWHIFDAQRQLEERYVTSNVFRYVQISLMKKIEARGGYAVIGSGEQLYKFKDAPYLEFTVGYHVPYEWCQRNGVEHEPYFYFVTPEITKAWMEIPIVDFALTHQPQIFANPNNGNNLKIVVLQGMFPEQPRRAKFNGFEALLEKRRAAEELLTTAFAGRLDPYHIAVKEFKRQLA